MSWIGRFRRTALLLFVAAALLPTPSRGRAPGPDSRDALVDELDAYVQRRFLDIDHGFGIRRIGGMGTAHVFQAENAEERSLTSRLKASGADLRMYLASLGAFGDEPSSADLHSYPRLGIRGPVWVTERKRRPAFDRRPLWQIAKRTLAEPSGATVTRHDEWVVSARVVRASDDSCVACHTTRAPMVSEGPLAERVRQTRIGDPLGVVIYVYK
jgi:hypothetical protein